MIFNPISRYVIALQKRPRIDDKTAIKFIDGCRTINFAPSEKEARCVISDLTSGEYVIDEDALRYADDVITRSIDLDINLILARDQSYPASLFALKSPPPLLHIRGNLDVLSMVPGVAIVGTRTASTNGETIAFRLGKFFAENGHIIVSGLALGIDAAAHSGALAANAGRTIAVLAHGLEHASPKANAELGQKILDNGGAWISEHSVGIPPLRHHFVPRNRIQVGLSSGSIIVEASLKSGSTSQANFCLRLNRPLFGVVPETKQNILNLHSEGTEMLVSDKGAYPIKSRDDYSDVLHLLERSRTNIVRRWLMPLVAAE